MIKKQSFGNGLIFLTVFAIFSGALVVHRLVNSCFYLLLLIAIVELILQPGAAKDFWAHCKSNWQINSALCAPFLAVLVHQLFRDEFSFRLYDLPARLMVFALIFWLMQKLPFAYLKRLKWAFIVGAIFYAADLYMNTNGGNVRIANINSFSIIFSSELAFLMGMFAILSIGWQQQSALSVVLQIIGGVAGLFSVYWSQTRGAWIAIPFFIFITISTLMHAQKTRTKIMVYVATVLMMAALFSASNIVQERIIDGKNDLTELSVNNNMNTSIGVRFQLWSASWGMFKEHPLFGVGKEHFSEQLQVLKQRGEITEAAAAQYHSHNEILYSMATMGIFGLLATLTIYLVPAIYFGRYMFHRDRQIHSAAAMGLSLCVGYFIFGLVDVMFGWNMCNVFYCVTIAISFAFIANRKKELEHGPETLTESEPASSPNLAH